MAQQHWHAAAENAPKKPCSKHRQQAFQRFRVRYITLRYISSPSQLRPNVTMNACCFAAPSIVNDDAAKCRLWVDMDVCDDAGECTSRDNNAPLLSIRGRPNRQTRPKTQIHFLGDS